MKNSTLLLACLVLSLASVVMSAAALARSRRAADETYQRILAEVRLDVIPVYRDFGIQVPADPKTFRELFGPLFRLADPTMPDTQPGT